MHDLFVILYDVGFAQLQHLGGRLIVPVAGRRGMIGFFLDPFFHNTQPVRLILRLEHVVVHAVVRRHARHLESNTRFHGFCLHASDKTGTPLRDKMGPNRLVCIYNWFVIRTVRIPALITMRSHQIPASFTKKKTIASFELKKMNFNKIQLGHF